MGLKLKESREIKRLKKAIAVLKLHCAFKENCNVCELQTEKGCGLGIINGVPPSRWLITPKGVSDKIIKTVTEGGKETVISK